MSGHVHTVAVFEVVKETSDAVTLVLDVPTELTGAFAYSPGQFLTLRIPSDTTGSVARCYSLSSSPRCDERLAVTVKRTAGGYASNWICDNVAVGTRIEMLPPSGRFVPRCLNDNVLLLAGGSGITPMMSILKSILADGRGKIALFYANRDSSATIFRTQIDELAERHAGRFQVTHWYESHQGVPTATDIARHAEPFTGREVYICGPEGFTEATRSALSALRIGEEFIHTEQYRSLTDNPFEQVAAAPVTATAGSALTVELDGATHELDWPSGTPLLDVLLAAGLDAPYVCRESACGTCVCSVRSGRTRMAMNESLIDEELEAGLTLACQTLRESEHVHIAFDQ